MLAEYINRRLASVPLSSEHRALLNKVIADADQDPRIHALHHLPLDIFHALGGDDDSIVMPFVAAWALLEYTVVRLDHLQDGDAEDHPLPTAPDIHASYNLVFSLVVVATSVLDNLDPRIPEIRRARLRRLWNACLLGTAGGQQQDLMSASSEARALDRLDEYQRLAHAKAGNVFALAFAGPAALVTDDEGLIGACQFAGDMFGALVQLGDDLRDQEAQRNHSGLTLPSAYAEAMRQLTQTSATNGSALWEYWWHIRDEYSARVGAALDMVRCPRLQTCVQQIFETAFGSTR